MFTKKITDSDAFIEMSSAAQALYFHLNQGADDDGFNNQIQMAMMKAHASTDDLKILLAKNFVIRFESGVIVIKHWRMHNTIRKDRYTETTYKDELLQLKVKDNGAYTLGLPSGCQTVAERLPSGCRSVGKDSLDKVSLVECSVEPSKNDVIVLGSFDNVYLSEDEYTQLKTQFPDTYEALIEKFSKGLKTYGYKYQNHYAAILKWVENDKQRQKEKQQDSSFDIDEFYKAALERTEREYKKQSKTAAEDPALLDRLKNVISS